MEESQSNSSGLSSVGDGSEDGGSAGGGRTRNLTRIRHPPPEQNWSTDESVPLSKLAVAKSKQSPDTKTNAKGIYLGACRMRGYPLMLKLNENGIRGTEG